MTTINRHTTLHKTVLALGTPDELALLKTLFNGDRARMMLRDDTSAMVPVRMAFELLDAAGNSPVKAALLRFLAQLVNDDVAWLVLDARAR